jgi:macrolide-specific efflux system membrane fusion protein
MKKFIVIAVVVIVAAAAGLALRQKKSGTVTYQEVQPTRGAIAVNFRETGTVSPRNRLEIKPPIGGRLESVLVVEGQKVKKGQIIAWMSSTDRAAMLDAARSKGEAEVKRWEDIYKPTPVVAPLDGFIIDRSKEPGQTVATADAIVVLADKLIVEATIDETDLRYIRLGQKVSMSLDAYPDEKIRGTVEQIAYESQVVNNVTVYTVKIRPDAVPANFRAGMTATVEVSADNRANALLLPFEVVTDTNGTKTVLVKTGTEPETRAIEIGVSNGKMVEIVSGITDSDTVLIAMKKREKQKQGFSLMPGPRNNNRKKSS